MKEATHQNGELKEKKIFLEKELKQSSDKVFDLRETIGNLETQVQQKGMNEHALEEEVLVSVFCLQQFCYTKKK